MLLLFKGTKFDSNFNNNTHYTFGVYSILLFILISLCFKPNNRVITNENRNIIITKF